MPTSAKFGENLNVQQFKVDHPRSTILVPIESAYTSSYFGPILHRSWDTATYWLKIEYFSYSSLIRRPRSLSSLWSFAVKLSIRKLESWGYSAVKVAWS